MDYYYYGKTVTLHVESGNMRRFQSLLHENMKIKLKVDYTM